MRRGLLLLRLPPLPPSTPDVQRLPTREKRGGGGEKEALLVAAAGWVGAGGGGDGGGSERRRRAKEKEKRVSSWEATLSVWDQKLRSPGALRKRLGKGRDLE